MSRTLRNDRKQRKKVSWYQLLIGLAFPLLAVAMIMLTYHPAEAAAASVTLKFESQALDLDTGMVVPWALKRPPGSEVAEVYIAYNSERVPHAVVALAGGGLEIGMAQGLPFELMTAQEAASLAYSTRSPSVPFTPSDTVVIKTSSGAVYKLGRAEESEDAVGFEYELMFVQ